MNAPNLKDCVKGSARAASAGTCAVRSHFLTGSMQWFLSDVLDLPRALPSLCRATCTLPLIPQVSWEFWTNSNDDCGFSCREQLKFIAVGGGRGVGWITVCVRAQSSRPQ